MDDVHVTRLSLRDARALRAMDALLARADIRRDPHLEGALALEDDDGELLAVGGYYENTLRCLAVDDRYRGVGLLATLVTELTALQLARGHRRLFLYTKPDAARQFQTLGFSEIARVPETLVFMENDRAAFPRYLADMRALRFPSCAVVVMNANPFTRGHLALLARASAENERVYCFVVSHDASLVPFAARLAMVEMGAAALANVRVLPSGEYMVSGATFPSYFLKDEATVNQTYARLDAAIFLKIADALGAARRYVGEEPFSQTTSAYNAALLAALPSAGVAVTVVPRVCDERGDVISASLVRKRIHDGALEGVRSLVPDGTYTFLCSDAGADVIARIRAAVDVCHH